MYDVIVIGAGPAGLMAGIELQKAGVNYLIIDGKSSLGTPMRCGEGLREKEFIDFFGHTNFPFVKNIVNTHRAQVLDQRREFTCRIIELDRVGWEQWMGEELNIRLNTKCLDVTITDSNVEVSTDQGNLCAKMILLCCGPQFVIQIKLGLIDTLPSLLPCYGGIYKNYGLDPHSFYFFFDDENAGYLWVFPKNKEFANIGYGNLHGKNIKVRFEEMCKRHQIGGEQVQLVTGVIPASGPIKRTYGERILVCGDAAGQVFAASGEGILYALKAGRFAAQTASNALRNNNFSKSSLKQYETLWKQDFGEILATGKMFADIGAVVIKHRLYPQLFARAPTKIIEQMVIQGVAPFQLKIAAHVQRVLPEKVFIQMMKILL